MSARKRTCWFCGKRVKSASITRDHLVPRCRGGAGVATVDACLYCNKKKGSQFLDEFRLKFGRPFAGEEDPGIGKPSWRATIGSRFHPDWEFAEKVSRVLEDVWSKQVVKCSEKRNSAIASGFVIPATTAAQVGTTQDPTTACPT